VQNIQSTQHDQEMVYDIVIIGAGVVGCAMARRFSIEGASVLIIEKAADILDGASKANSAILHTGFDAPNGSLELSCIKAGYQEYQEIHEQLQLPIMKTGAIVVAWNAVEEARLGRLMDHARTNGIEDIELLTAKQITEKEPHLSRSARGGFHVPREYVIDPWTSPYAYLMQAIENGARVLRNAEIKSGAFDGTHWRLHTPHDTIRCRTTINCAGLYGDHVDTTLNGKSSFEIRPRKGQFLVYDKAANALISSIILPVPSETTKGIVVCRTIFGNLLVGPTAEEQESRNDASVQKGMLNFLREKAEQMIPELSNQTITATYAGIRPATKSKDYQIQHDVDRHYISVGGIRSTGLSAALGIASYVYDKYSNAGYKHNVPEPLNWPTVQPIAETEPRDWSKPDNGGVICHCELVTRREVQQALEGPLAANSIGGLKRRTRVTMGRCQGFYCSAQLSEMTAGKFDQPLGIGATADDK